MRATAFSSSSSFKLLDLIDLTIFPDSNLKLGKIKPFTTVCITHFHVSAVPLFLSYLSSSKITELCFFIHFQRIDVKNKRCFSGLSLISIILWEYCENNIKRFWYYSYENKRIISRKAKRLFLLRLFKAFPPVRLYLFS